MKWCIAEFNPIIISKDHIIQKVTLSENRNWSIIEIIIRDQTMYYFPKFNTNLFDEIIKLVISNSKLKQIHREDLKQFPKLSYLEIINNDLAEIDNDLFDDNPLIIDVKLNENKIKSIPFEVVMNLEKYEGPMSFINKNKYSEILSKYKNEVREKNKYLVDRDTLINQLQANNTKSTEIIEELEKEKEKLKIEQNELQVNKIQSSEHIQKLQLEIEVLNGKLSNCQQIIQTTENLLTTTTLDTKIVDISTEKRNTEFNSITYFNTIIIAAISITIFLFIELIFYSLYMKLCKKSSSDDSNQISSIKTIQSSSSVCNNKQESQIKVNEYEVPLPYEEHIYDEINLNDITLYRNNK
ncbi:hypothetical protein PVAND_015554 [Polypedilum vanderplanki]|uniref:Uncharacterized protein n=1 Tax=Polypedilum vanderplanki TaxID=319348 RepID=A0A9J6BCI1_POLVA|nr:hypothetical protein PVAND_015554 [Polypedilum vanderplanki]